jgi:hypothetical protein
LDSRKHSEKNGDPNADVNVIAPEVDCDSHCDDLKWKRDKKTKCIVPSDSKTPDLKSYYFFNQSNGKLILTMPDQ